MYESMDKNNLQFVSANLRKRIESFLESQSVSFRLKSWIEQGLNCDCLDGLKDAEQLATILKEVFSDICPT